MAELKLNHFFENDLKPYSIYDSQRSLPSAIDGLKITARKVLYTCLNSNITTDFKVAQLQSKVAFDTSYMHGEVGIGGVICLMAQNFAGSNNIPLLLPEGQFGSRLNTTPAATRYIYTKLSPDTRKLFKKEDDLILEHNYDDDQKIEPKFYLPILPVVLINAAQGIGTGFAAKVLSYNPKDLKEDILAILKNKKRKKLIPWYRGYTGTIEEGENENQWIIKGRLEIINTTTIRITELPIGTYLDDIKDTLAKLKEKDIIKDYDDNSTEEAFNIEVTCPRTTTSLPIEKLYEHFKLISKDTENLTLWNANDKLQVFKSASDIVDYFTSFRLSKYEERRLALIKVVEGEILELDEKIRFINFYLDNSGVFRNTPKKELMDLLIKQEFMSPDKLLSMPIYNLTKDKIEEIQKTLETKIEYLNTLQEDNATSMYIRELEELKL